MSELIKEIENGRLLKNYGSWMYCDKCNKTVGYLVYSTYQNFDFNFDCKCGNKGSFKLCYETDLPIKLSFDTLKTIKNRLCCPNDNSPLLTIVDKNIEKVEYSVTCKKCLVEYRNVSRPIIREIKESEFSFLEEMLYQAIYVPVGQNKPPREIINQPELSQYFSNFGKENDFCLVAELKGKLIGAIWIRLFNGQEKGYGYVNNNTPELSMAILEEYRSNGIGKLLLNTIIQSLKPLRYSQISLSVDKQNYAYDFYKKNGFIGFESTEKSVTMIKKL